MKNHLQGFQSEPNLRANGERYPGRFTCSDVQWTAGSHGSLATFTVTARELADAAESRLVWTDQGVQRGVKPGVATHAKKELALADGYPDESLYVFSAENADDIVEKLLGGKQLFLNPLVWNLRPGTFKAYWDEGSRGIWIYSAKVYLPDSHHRHQAILKAVRTYNDEPEAYPEFSPNEQFKIELYFLTREVEGEYFFDKNQRPRPVAKSKAYDLTNTDDLSVLAKEVITRSKTLTGNINRVTDRLTRKNPQVATLSTIRQMVGIVAPSTHLDSSELNGIAETISEFLDLLAEVRPELGKLSAPERARVRDESLIDAAVMIIAYAYLLLDFRSEVPKMGLNKALSTWRRKLDALTGEKRFKRWKGDLFSRANPLWREIGVLKPRAKSERLTVSNTGATRAECGRVLRQVIAAGSRVNKLDFLAVS